MGCLSLGLGGGDGGCSISMGVVSGVSVVAVGKASGAWCGVLPAVSRV